MNIQDATKILEINGEYNSKTVKDAYRKASSKYHPDKGGSVEMMQAVNEAYETLKNTDGSVKHEKSAFEYPTELNEAIKLAVSLSGVIVEVCGAWVWLTGDTRKHKEAIKNAGFKWAKKKIAWYFRPDDWVSSGKGKMSLDDIRGVHGSQVIKDVKRKKTATLSFNHKIPA